MLSRFLLRGQYLLLLGRKDKIARKHKKNRGRKVMLEEPKRKEVKDKIKNKSRRRQSNVTRAREKEKVKKKKLREYESRKKMEQGKE